MSDLKNQIFTLLKKCPNEIYLSPESNDFVVSYYNNGNVYDLNFIYSKTLVTIGISNGTEYIKQVEVTEKEYMELKWTAEEWSKVLEEKAFEEFKEFAEMEPSSMDDLLND